MRDIGSAHAVAKVGQMSPSASSCCCMEGGDPSTCQCPCMAAAARAVDSPHRQPAPRTLGGNPSSAAQRPDALPVTPVVASRRQTGDPLVEELGSRAKSWWPTLSEGGARRRGDGPVVIARTPTSAAASKGVHGYQSQPPQPSTELSALFQGGVVAIDSAAAGATPVLTASRGLKVRHPSSSKRPRQQPVRALVSVVVIDTDEDDSDEPGPKESRPSSNPGANQLVSLAELKAPTPARTTRTAPPRPGRPFAHHHHPSSRNGGAAGGSSPKGASLASSIAFDSSSSSSSEEGDPTQSRYHSGASSAPLLTSARASSLSSRRPLHRGGPPPRPNSTLVDDDDEDDSDDLSSDEDEVWSDAGSGSQVTHSAASRRSTSSPSRGTIRRQLQQHFHTPHTSSAGAALESAGRSSQGGGESENLVKDIIIYIRLSPSPVDNNGLGN